MKTFAEQLTDLTTGGRHTPAETANVLSAVCCEVVAEFRAVDSRLRARNRVLAQKARRDSLTGIANHATLAADIATEVQRAQRYGTAFSVLFVDIDHFKEVNDTHGHAAGDRVLCSVVEKVAAALRPGDVFGRYGGDEFVVGLVSTNARAALRVAERLRRDIERLHLGAPAEQVPVTLTIGIATLRSDEASRGADLVERADQAMLVAKAAGRNTVFAAKRRQNPKAVTFDSARVSPRRVAPR